MSRPTYTSRGSRGAAPRHDASAPMAPSEAMGSAVQVAVAATATANEEVKRSDDLAAMFLSLDKPDPVAEDPSATVQLPDEVAPQAIPAPLAMVSRPRFGGRPRFGATARSAAAPDQDHDVQAALGSADGAPAVSADQAEDPLPDLGLGRLIAKEVDVPPSPVYESFKGPYSKKETLSSAAVRALRADVKSASIVTDLVSAMALRPGSDAEVALKSKVLTSLLIQARHSADDLIQMVDPARADVGWVRAQALSQTASMLAREWTSDVLGEDALRHRMELRMGLVRAVLMDQGGEVERALAEFASGDHYKECVDAQSVADHRAVAIHQSAWALADAVTMVKDRKGEVFSFGMPQTDVVAALMQQAVSIVNTSRPDIRDPEASTTYMRGAIRRATTLVAAEYRSKSAEACAWVDAAEGAELVSQRLSACPKMFAETVTPFIAHWGLKNFQSIERAARKLIEESQDEQKSADRPGH